jgi:hypothetical protein
VELPWQERFLFSETPVWERLLKLNLSWTLTILTFFIDSVDFIFVLYLATDFVCWKYRRRRVCPDHECFFALVRELWQKSKAGDTLWHWSPDASCCVNKWTTALCLAWFWCTCLV